VVFKELFENIAKSSFFDLPDRLIASAAGFP